MHQQPKTKKNAVGFAFFFCIFVLFSLKTFAPEYDRIVAYKVSKSSASFGTLSVSDFGARGDSTFDNTAIIQHVIDLCGKSKVCHSVKISGPRKISNAKIDASTRKPNGKTEYVFLSGPIFLHSNMTLSISHDSTLRGTPDIKQYKLTYTRAEGKMKMRHASLINAGRCLKMNQTILHMSEREKNGIIACKKWKTMKNITITGGGVIDGNGHRWQEKLEIERPPLISFTNTNGIKISDIQLQNSPFCAFHPLFSTNVQVKNIAIFIPEHSKNTNGIDLDSCTHVKVSNSSIVTGGDCIAIKSGLDLEGRKINKPSQNILIEKMNFGYCNGLSI
eukprot:Awhi_evm1s10425